MTDFSIQDLETLGGKRLAKLLLDVAASDADVERRLRRELAAAAAPERLAAEIRERLADLVGPDSFINRRKVRALATELDAQRRLIVDRVARSDAAEALDLLWRFMDLAGPLHRRTDDGDGLLDDVFATARDDLAALAGMAKPTPQALADRTFEALQHNSYGAYDGLIDKLSPTLGTTGLERLKAQVVALSKTLTANPSEDEGTPLEGDMDGFDHDKFEERGQRHLVRQLLQEIADAQGDVDGYIAQYDAQELEMPTVAASIAWRLLEAGRAKEALTTLDAAPRRRGTHRWEWRWEDARIDTLEALGRPEEAQAMRWKCFETALSVEHFRDYLAGFPDPKGVQAEEERAVDHAERHHNPVLALHFLTSWGAVDRMARTVIRHAGKLNGNADEVLVAAAGALAGEYPLAATLALRSMIDITLRRGQTDRYRDATRYLLKCSALSGSIRDWGAFEAHDAYVERLRTRHARQKAFWDTVG